VAIILSHVAGLYCQRRRLSARQKFAELAHTDLRHMLTSRMYGNFLSESKNERSSNLRISFEMSRLNPRYCLGFKSEIDYITHLY